MDYNKKSISILLIPFAIIAGCGGEVQQKESIPQADKVVSEATNIYTLNNKVFIIPSPVQTMQLFKKIGYKYDKNLMNSTDKISNYKTKIEKGLNIGIYGGDLGYIILNEQSQDAIAYIGAAKKLAEELGATNMFDANAMSNLDKNIGNQAELMKVITAAYQKCDEYFKENNEGDVAAMIIAAAWLESIHFAAQIANATKEKEMISHVGEQKQTLDNLIMLVNPYYSKKEAPQFSAFIDDLTGLQIEYRNVGFRYTYKESTVDAGKKLAVVNSVSEVSMSEMTLQRIIRMIGAIRTKIIENSYSDFTGSAADTTATADTTKK